MTKRWFTTWGRRVLSEVRLGNCTQIWGWAKFEERGTHGWGKIVLHTCSDLSRLVWTYAQYSDYVRSSRCHFLHFRMLLFFSLTSYPGEIAYFNSPNRQLSNGARVMELYWNRNVDPSSPCLNAIDRKSFERGNFLVLCPALLKITYFNSDNQQLSIAVLPKELRQRKIVDPLEAHHNAQSSKIFLSFQPKN